MKRINCHMHLLNFEFIPDDFFSSRSIFTEDIIKHPKFNKILRTFISFISPLMKVFGFGDFMNLPDIIRLMRNNIEVIAEEYIKEMDAANILIATPLMMDIEMGSTMAPEISYIKQVEIISQVCRKYNGRLQPFIGIDPRRKNSFSLMKRAIEDLGFMGVKLYPPLGFHMNPLSKTGPASIGHKELSKIYAYCEEHQVPITAHCSKGGAYSQRLIKNQAFGDYLAHPKHIRKVLEVYPRLRINLAHIGGDLYEFSDPKTWSREVVSIVNQYKNAYTDLCCQTQCFCFYKDGEFKKAIRQLLGSPITENKIILGSDWPITGISWTEKEYCDNLGEVIGQKFINVSEINPIRFLYGEARRLPERFLDFYESHGIEIDSRITSLILNMGSKGD